MNVSGTGPGPVQPVPNLTPHSPIGKPAVGLETPEHKDTPLPPVEESTESARLRKRLQEGAVDADAGRDEPREGDEPAAQQDGAGAEPEPPAGPAPSTPAFRALRDLAPTAPHPSARDLQDAIDNGRDTPAPGSLLDQRA